MTIYSRLFPTFSSMKFSGFMLRSLIHLGLSFVQGEKYGTILIFLQPDIPFYQHKLLKTLCFFTNLCINFTSQSQPPLLSVSLHMASTSSPSPLRIGRSLRYQITLTLQLTEGLQSLLPTQLGKQDPQLGNNYSKPALQWLGDPTEDQTAHLPHMWFRPCKFCGQQFSL